MSKNLYQTVEDRDNADEIEAHGPYLGNASSAWLGQGYYFWDSAIELAHWWGRKRYPQKGYIICRSIIQNDDCIFDLYNNHEHRILFRDFINIVREEMGIFDVRVPEVIEYVRRHTDVFKNYKGIRALGTKSAGNAFANYRIKFVKSNVAYLDICPAIQYCITDISILGGYTIAYPDYYCI